MKTICMHPRCANIAVWGIRSEGERDTYKVCVKHRAQALDSFQKLGYEPTIEFLTATVS